MDRLHCSRIIRFDIARLACEGLVDIRRDILHFKVLGQGELDEMVLQGLFIISKSESLIFSVRCSTI